MPKPAAPPSLMIWIKRGLLAALSCYWALIFLLTHLPARELPPVSLNDKIEHFLAYGMLGGLLYLNFWAFRPRQRRLGWMVWGIGLAYGAIDEWLQYFVGRDCELNDWLADAAAVTIAVVVLSAVKWFIDRRGAIRDVS